MAVRKSRRLGGVALLAVAGLVLSACGEDAPAGTGVFVLVVGGHANAPTPTLSTQVKGLLDDAGRAGSAVALVSAEGEPRLIDEASLLGTAANPQAREQQQNHAKEAVLAAAEGVSAETPENDLLGAITKAARTAAAHSGTRTIAVVDNGLHTTDPLKFQDDDMLAADPTEVTDFLKSSNLLPDLSGTTVLFNGIGDVAAPQMALTTAQQKNLVAIWTAVLTASGAQVKVDPTPLDSEPRTGLPDVSVVKVPTGGYVAAPVSVGKPAEVSLTQDKVAFVADKATFIDAGEADATLRPLAAQITSQGWTVHLVGSTSSHGTAPGRMKLSTLRAAAVRDRLVALGVSSSAITSEGVGCDWPGYVEDHAPGGGLLLGPAAQNRKVTVQLSA